MRPPSPAPPACEAAEPAWQVSRDYSQTTRTRPPAAVSLRQASCFELSLGKKGALTMAGFHIFTSGTTRRAGRAGRTGAACAITGASEGCSCCTTGGGS